MYLFRLIYYSKNTAVNPNDPHLRADLKNILATAKRNNMANGVTGALLFNPHYFAQVLEGDRKAVTETFCRISRDSRHSEPVILEAKPINKRRFADWSMCFVGQPVSEGIHRQYCVSEQFKPMKMTAESLLGFVEELIEHNPGAVRTNKPNDGTNDKPGKKKIFGERVLNRDKYRKENAPAEA